MATTESSLSPEAIQHHFRAKELLECKELGVQYNATNRGGKVGEYCPPIWDGILCWNATRAGETVVRACPWFFFGFDPRKNASKKCLSNGVWFRAKESEYESWTNFSQCSSSPPTLVLSVDKSVNESFIEPYLPTLRTISEVGYSISLISLLIAFTILISIKKLRCPRNVLHMHLFASFIMRAFMSLLKDSVFVLGLATETDIMKKGEDIYFNSEQERNWSCRLIVSVWNYFIMANYSWILMEGLYLHNLIFLALFTDSSSIALYVALGWGLPLIFMLPWTICRAYLENDLCWTINKNTIIFLLIQGPLTAIVVVNFFIFINIAKVLFRKLQSSVCEETKTYRRWAKSTLVLIPLFGVHYMILQALQYSKRSTVELIWLFCDRIFTCFNGFFVALLYCFLNGEVKNELAKKWEHFSLRELLKRWHLAGRGSIFSSMRFPRNGRHRRPHGSGCSSASCTVDSYVHSCRDKKRNLAVHTTHAPCKRVVREEALLIEHKDGSRVGGDSSEFKNGLSRTQRGKRWSTSDYDSQKNVIELKRMISLDNIANV
ncbi:hypothetical protein R5R35_001625 [Gryllus longicercus]|uniref:Parathyroid hormone/parathyroid hormone-related peptide receptor n=1 Tax=Gryllus longicercus TaxID=2509291 RepID=A0AAN9Z7Q6_9ORTH